MSLAFDAERQGRRFERAGTQTERSAAALVPGRAQPPNTISASQARAARRREQLRDAQAVSAWLRELAGRPH